MRWVRSDRLAAALSVLLASGATIAPLLAQQGTPAKTLAVGKGSDLTMARCAICHDITHVTRAKLSRGEWEDNVRNMIERGAPITPDEVPVIIEYLATYYNRDAAAPSADTSSAGSAGPQDTVQRLLADNACLGCHGIDQKIVGPSFKEVAARYAASAAAPDTLAAKIKAGGTGVWGRVPMPPHPHLSAAELRQLADWVLERK